MLWIIDFFIIKLFFNLEMCFVDLFQIIYPHNAKLTEEDKTNICYLAFPDSNSGCMGDTKFHIRIRQAPNGPSLLPNHVTYNQKCPVFLQADSSYYYGFVYFRQVKDVALPRGYFQKVIRKIGIYYWCSLFRCLPPFVFVKMNTWCFKRTKHFLKFLVFFRLGIYILSLFCALYILGGGSNIANSLVYLEWLTFLK